MAGINTSRWTRGMFVKKLPLFDAAVLAGCNIRMAGPARLS
jgi:hypothetical protein